MVNERFQSTKLIEGFSTCFRQWKAKGTHCRYIHGYAISFKVIFEGPLDDRNWVVDFGFMKRCKTGIKDRFDELVSPDKWFRDMFDHTIVVAEDDPDLPSFLELDDMSMARVRVIPKVGCEMFAKFVYDKLNEFLFAETEDRVRVVSVECFEHSKNSAIYTNQ